MYHPHDEKELNWEPGAVRLGVEWLAAGPGATDLLLPRPALGKMQGQPACRAGEPPGQGEEPPPEGPGGHDPFTQAEPRRPAGQVVRHHLYRQPGSVGGEAARGEMVQPDAVLEVSDGILDGERLLGGIGLASRGTTEVGIKPRC